MSVLVTDGNQRSALAVVRSLGRAGVPVLVGETRQPSLAATSRYCAGDVCYPDPSRVREFRTFILDYLRSQGVEAVLPMTDIATLTLAEMRESLPPSVLLPIPSRSAILTAQNKAETVVRARRIGLPAPATWFPTPETIREAAAQVRYPAVLKPRFSRVLRDGRWRVGEVQFAADADELVRLFLEMHEEIPEPIVQERIRGDGIGVFLLVWDGQLKAAFSHRRLREKPPWGGVSVLRESIPADPRLVQRSYELLREMDWQGVAMVEMKVDDRDGEPKLMEVNGRFWGSLQLAVDAGMNFPLMLYRLAKGESVPTTLEYRPFVRLRWFLGDLDQLLLRLRKPERMNGGSSRWQACREFFEVAPPGQHSEIMSDDDPGPGFFELRNYLRDMVQRGGHK